MNDMMNQLPEEVIYCIENYAFASLNQQQKRMVLDFCSEEEYDDMHRICRLLREKKSAGNGKERLLKAFDEKHKSAKIVSIKSYSSIAWKAAVILLMLGVGVLQWSILQQKSGFPLAISAVQDTVYLSKQVISEPLKIHDTIFATGFTKAKLQSRTASHNDEDKLKASKIAPVAADIHIQSLDDLANVPNRQRKSNVQSDSLLRHFQLVTL
jgi:hypothetical protein